MSVTPGMREFGGIGDQLDAIRTRLDKLELQRRAQSTSLDGGTYRVKGGGTIEILDGSGNTIHQFDINGMTVFESDGSTLMQLDGTGIRLNDGSGTKLIDLTTSGLQAYEADGSTLLTLDGSKLRFNRSDGTRSLEVTPAGGMKFYEANGTTVITTLDGSGLTVGSDVVIDSTGLEVIGGMVTPIWVARFADQASNFSLTTSRQVANSVVVSPPSWVQTVYLQIGHFGQISDASAKNLEMFLDIGAGEFGAISVHVESGASPNAAGRQSTVEVTSFPVTVEQKAEVSTGTNSSNQLSLSVMAFGIRNP